MYLANNILVWLCIFTPPATRPAMHTARGQHLPAFLRRTANIKQGQLETPRRSMDRLRRNGRRTRHSRIRDGNFFAEEARPYWHASIRHSMAKLKATSTSTEYKKISEKQNKWLRSLSKELKKAFKSTGDEEGTVALYIGEGQATEIVRLRALDLGCEIEQAQSRK